MANKEKSLLGYAVIVNSLQIVLCFIIYLLRKFEILDFSVTQGFLFIAELLIWLIGAGACSLGMRMIRMRQAFLYATITLLPIIILTAVSASIGFLGEADIANWTAYFFIGSAVSFWHRPALILSVFIKNSAYVIFGINILILYVISMIGANYGMILNSSKNRSKNTAKKKRVKKRAPSKKSSVKGSEPISEVQKKAAKKTVDSTKEEDI